MMRIIGSLGLSVILAGLFSIGISMCDKEIVAHFNLALAFGVPLVALPVAAIVAVSHVPSKQQDMVDRLIRIGGHGVVLLLLFFSGMFIRNDNWLTGLVILVSVAFIVTLLPGEVQTAEFSAPEGK